MQFAGFGALRIIRPRMDSPRTYRASIEALAWTIIAGMIALTLLLHYSPRWKTLRKPAAIPTPSTDLVYIARYAVGTKVMFRGVQSDRTLSTLRERMEEAAHGPADQLRLIAAEAELGLLTDPQPRLKELLASNPTAPLAADIKAAQTIYRNGTDHLTPTQQADLVAHHEWFGRLMLAWGHAPSDPERHQVEAAAQRTVAGAFGLGCIGLLMILVGLVLLILAIVFAARGQFFTAYLPPPFASTQFVEAVALYMAGFMAGSIALAYLFRGHNVGIWINWLLLPVVALAIFWPRLRGVSLPEWRYAMGYHAGKGIWREIGAGITGYLAMLPALALAAMLTNLLMHKFPGENPTHPIIHEFGKGPWTLLQVYLLACIWAPITEEAMFRGALFHHLRARVGFWPTALIVSFIFAVIHPQGILGLPALMVIAIFLALLRQWRSSLIASMTAHAMSNFVVTTIAAMTLG